MNDLFTAHELPQQARAARKHAGLTQDQAADRLGVRQSAISMAERDDSGAMRNLQLRMMQELAGWDVEALWRIEKLS